MNCFTKDGLDALMHEAETDEIRTMEQEVKKTKGQIFSKIVWIVAAVFNAIMTIGTISDLINGITLDSTVYFIKMVLYLVAFILGLVYLFKSEKEKFALAAASIYAGAAVLGYVANLCGGSNYAPLDMIHMTVNAIVFILFAITIAIFLKGKTSGAFSLCAKLWWLPSAISMLMALIVSINTEVNDSHGFDVSLVVMDVVIAILLLLPMFEMTLTVKNRLNL